MFLCNSHGEACCVQLPSYIIECLLKSEPKLRKCQKHALQHCVMNNTATSQQLLSRAAASLGMRSVEQLSLHGVLDELLCVLKSPSLSVFSRDLLTQAALQTLHTSRYLNDAMPSDEMSDVSDVSDEEQEFLPPYMKHGDFVSCTPLESLYFRALQRRPHSRAESIQLTAHVTLALHQHDLCVDEEELSQASLQCYRTVAVQKLHDLDGGKVGFVEQNTTHHESALVHRVIGNAIQRCMHACAVADYTFDAQASFACFVREYETVSTITLPDAVTCVDHTVTSNVIEELSGIIEAGSELTPEAAKATMWHVTRSVRHLCLQQNLFRDAVRAKLATTRDGSNMCDALLRQTCSTHLLSTQSDPLHAAAMMYIMLRELQAGRLPFSRTNVLCPQLLGCREDYSQRQHYEPSTMHEHMQRYSATIVIGSSSVTCTAWRNFYLYINSTHEGETVPVD